VIFCPLPLACCLLPRVIAQGVQVFLLVRALFGEFVHGLGHLFLDGGDHLGQPDGLCLGLALMACHANLLPQTHRSRTPTRPLPGGGDERTLIW
jgi:hypothetical protein